MPSTCQTCKKPTTGDTREGSDLCWCPTDSPKPCPCGGTNCAVDHEEPEIHPLLKGNWHGGAPASLGLSICPLDCGVSVDHYHGEGGRQDVRLPEKPKEESWEKAYDDHFLGGTNPAVIWGMKRLEWKDVLEIGVFSGKFNLVYDLLAKQEERIASEKEKSRLEGYEKGKMDCINDH